MSSIGPIVERALDKIEESDLRRLAELARSDREDLFSRIPSWRRLSDRLLCVTLCQGAALHYWDGTNGVKDLDVWTFYAHHPDASFNPRRVRRVDFGPSHLGRHPNDPELTGRAVDFMGRSLRCPVGTDPVLAVRAYLTEGRSVSARMLAQKAVVMVEPAQLRGQVIWAVGRPVR